MLIITAGEDEYIKFWDTKFQLINEINLRKNPIYEDPIFKKIISTKNFSA